MGFVAAAGHAGVCAGLCLHRFFAVWRPASNGVALNIRAARPSAARGAQLRRRGAGVYCGALSVCLLAGTRRPV